jgi:ABC-type branched-subunit amino acid transport system ATPase component
MLEYRNVGASFSGFRALHDISFKVQPGERVAIFGHNGANRTTDAAIVMVEQNVAATLHMVERAIVLKTGRLIFDGPSAELAAHEDIWSWF